MSVPADERCRELAVRISQERDLDTMLALVYQLKQELEELKRLQPPSDGTVTKQA